VDSVPLSQIRKRSRTRRVDNLSMLPLNWALDVWATLVGLYWQIVRVFFLFSFFNYLIIFYLSARKFLILLIKDL
jgi:hypothetical protein